MNQYTSFQLSTIIFVCAIGFGGSVEITCMKGNF